MERYQGVQVLRGVAALLVLVAHSAFISPQDLPSKTFATDGGAIGVDIFFVISGFVIALASSKPQASASTFLINRITRVLPLYYGCSLLVMLHEPSTAIQRWNTFFLIPVFDTYWYTNPIHWFGWSIAVEMWFYALFSISMRISHKHRLGLFFALGSLFVLLGYLYSGTLYFPHFIGSAFIINFFLGVLIFVRRASITRAEAIACTAIGSILVIISSQIWAHIASHLSSLSNLATGSFRALVWGVPSALLVMGIVGLDRDELIRWPSVALILGEMSYSFYLVQPFALLMLGGLIFNSQLFAWITLFTLVASLAFLSHRYVETPVTRVLRRAIFGQPVRLLKNGL